MNKLVKVYKAIGDETRFKILALLSSRNICAKGIANRLGISEAAVSQHIKILKEAKLITGYKKGYHIMYELNTDVLNEAIDLLNLLINHEVPQLKSEYAKDEITQCMTPCKWVKGCCKKEKGD